MSQTRQMDMAGAGAGQASAKGEQEARTPPLNNQSESARLAGVPPG